MFLNSWAAWSAVLKIVFNQETIKKHFSFHNFVGFKFPVAELAPKLVNFLCHCAASRYPLCFEVCFCQLILFSPPSALLQLLQHTLHIAKPSPLRDFTFPGFLNEFEFVTSQIVESYTIFLVLWWNWLWIDHHLFFNVSIFFMAPILLGNNWKVWLKWKQNWMLSRS